jgi:serine/threonine protein kinase
VLHRDLKLSNLLYNHRGELKVADFGLARRVGGEFVGDKFSGNMSLDTCLTPKVASLWYRPPELLFGSEHYDQGVDNWGAGCAFGEFLRGKPLMDGKNELEQLQKMVSSAVLLFCFW